RTRTTSGHGYLRNSGASPDATEKRAAICRGRATGGPELQCIDSERVWEAQRREATPFEDDPRRAARSSRDRSRAVAKWLLKRQLESEATAAFIGELTDWRS